MNEQTVTLPVSGMTCVNCAMNIERGVKKLPGVSESNVNFAAEQANVSFDPGLLTVQDLVGGIEKAGYSVPAAKIDLPITGMTCTNCSANIERALNKKTPGVVQASVNFASERASIEYLPGVVTIDEIVDAIKKAGYNAILPEGSQTGEDAEQAARDAEIRDQTNKFIVGLIFALPLFLMSMARDFSFVGPWSHAAWVNWLFFALATPVQFYTGWDYYTGDTRACGTKVPIWMCWLPSDPRLLMYTPLRCCSTRSGGTCLF